MVNFPTTLGALLPAAAFVQGQGQYGGSSSSATSAGMAKATPTGSSSASIHTVEVGQGGLKFVPDSFTAAVGDQVEFKFVSSGHSVAEGDFNKACDPLNADAFYSGFVNPGGKPFTITVNSTDPMWFYCTAVGHCQGGMVGVINAPKGQTVEDYAAAAKKTSKSQSPAKVQGGVFGVAQSGGSGGSGGSGTSSGSSSASSSSASAKSTQSNAASGMVVNAMGLALPAGLLAYNVL